MLAKADIIILGLQSWKQFRPSRWLKNPFGTGTTQHSRRSGTAPERPAGWSKRLPSAAAASEEAKGGVLYIQYVELPSATRTKLTDFLTILPGNRELEASLDALSNTQFN